MSTCSNTSVKRSSRFSTRKPRTSRISSYRRHNASGLAGLAVDPARPVAMGVDLDSKVTDRKLRH